MKYPQLVSTRAVNAISDWLVSRLEQLGVEAPQIYTRLLLSLLQSSVQINDPIEFNSLETFIGNRKGGSIRRYLHCDANSLKKLNAVQCLSEIVSSEQELTAIESLVDELWEKLNDIEKQLDCSNGDQAILVHNAVSSASGGDNDDKSEANAKTQAKESLSNNCKKSYHNHNKNNNNEKRTIVCRGGGGGISKSVESETDPKKRYFNAFPALSKEMEDSFRIWRRNSKSLTWPADRANIIASSAGLNLSNSIKSGGDVNSTTTASAAAKHDDLNVSKLDNRSGSSNNATISSTGGGLKRRTRRRKSQSMSKGRAMPNTRKTASNDNVINVMSTTGNCGANRRANRHMSPTQWDTDFDGYWEMGRDLIKEFFAKQGEKNKNQKQKRYTMDPTTTQDVATENNNKTPSNEEESDETKLSSSPFMPPVDISFCCCDDSIDDDDTYKSIVELTSDISSGQSRSSPRRLYQRLAMPGDGGDASTENDVQADILQLKSKFNSKIASIWQTNSEDENTTNNDNDESSSSSTLWSAPSNLPWPHVAPIKENLKNFWTSFYNRQFDLGKKPNEEKEDQRVNLEAYPDVVDVNACSSLPYNMAATMPPNVAAKPSVGGNSDFHSMPFHLEGLDMTDGCSAIAGRNKVYKKLDGRRTPVGVFLQDSIWSENLNGGKNTDTDESFYMKVWNSNRKLYNLDAIYERKINDESKIDHPCFQFSAYGNSKWSEGINAGPNSSQIQEKKQQTAGAQQLPLNVEVLNQSIDCTDASISNTTSCSSSTHTLSSSGIFSGQTPTMQSSLQLNDNVQSLSEAYGKTSPISDECPIGTAVDNDEQQTTLPVSLLNHSDQSSGFVEYSRVKSFAQSRIQQQQQKPLRNYQAQMPYYYDDPNENLLTSERTHFKPIKAYADGYTFDVCSALEAIEYKRSESGYLYFESEKYLEYTRKDTFMAEEENTGTTVASTAPLYAGSNCEAAISQKRKKENNSGSELVLKFRIKNHEIACQTEDEATIKRMCESSAGLQEQHPLYLIFSGAFTEGLKIPTSGQACSNAIEALNKAVAAAAKAAAEQNQSQVDTSPWRLGINELMDTSRRSAVHHDPSLIWTAVQATPREEIAGVDEIDFCNESSLSSSCIYGNSNSMDSQQQQQQQWSMRNNNEKNCQSNAGTVCPAAKAGNSENNNCLSMQQNSADMHSLWGMCAACNNYKSAPANNLLRDELKLEADQIMSDLKNMQDLYIGCSNGGQQDSDDDDEDDMDNYYYSGDCFWGRHALAPKNLKHPCPITLKAAPYTAEVGRRREEDFGDRKTPDWEQNGLEMRQKETQQKVLQQVNKLIAHLMRPEQANDTNVLADAAASAHRELGESLWPDDGGHNIWKQHNNDSCSRWKQSNQFERENPNALPMPPLPLPLPMRPSRHSVLCDEEKNFLSQLTWEHENLAEIWTKSTPPLTATTNEHEQHQQPKQSLPLSAPPKPPVLLCSSSADACSRENSEFEKAPSAAAATNTKNSSPSTSTSTNTVETRNEQNNPNENSDNNVSLTASNVNYKRIQQFLNSTGGANGVSSAKLKLSNRKRRHSASQNYAIFYNNGLGGITTQHTSNHKSNTNNNNNNNNNTKVSDLNNYNFKRNASNTKKITADDEKSDTAKAAAAPTATANFSEDVDMLDHGINDSDAYFLIKNNGDNMILPPKQTIITCQYWTTIDPIMDTDGIECTEEGSTTFSCLVDKNDAILKHVTMLARPLTR